MRSDYQPIECMCIPDSAENVEHIEDTREVDDLSAVQTSVVQVY